MEETLNAYTIFVEKPLEIAVTWKTEGKRRIILKWSRMTSHSGLGVIGVEFSRYIRRVSPSPKSGATVLYRCEIWYLTLREEKHRVSDNIWT
jgi:hypothetical protein